LFTSPKAANTAFIDGFNQMPLRLPKKQSQEAKAKIIHALLETILTMGQ
jgi:hypothetical protein